MFGFFKKNLVDSGLFDGLTDYHSHLLPEVDDGVQSEEETIKILNQYEEMSVKEVVLTPHIMEEYPENTAEYLKQRYDDLLRVYKGNVKLVLGAEYMLDNSFSKHLNVGRLLTIDTDTILVEMSYMGMPVNLWDLIDRIKSSGYNIVLAHPERYSFLNQNDYVRLKKEQIKFQLNILSFAGYYGIEAQKRVQKLLALNYYELIGSDIHSSKQLFMDLCTIKLSKNIIRRMKDLSL